MKALDVTYFWRRRAPFERLKRELLEGSGGMLPQEIFNKEHSETLFPAFLEIKYHYQTLVALVTFLLGGMTLIYLT